MKLFNTLRAFWRGGTIGFNALESKMLRSVIDNLDAHRAQKLRQRIERINLVQRLDGGREVNTYEMQHGKPVTDSSERLIDEDGEKVLAEFSFSTVNGISNRGKVWMVDGRFFSLEFDDPTEHIVDDELKSISVKLMI